MADSSTTSSALAKRSSDSALMPPPQKRIKRPTKVLEEDDYTDALSHIIARDFFPGLLETEAKQEYLSALDSQDSKWIASAGRKLTEVMTPGPDGRKLRGRRGTSLASRAYPLSGQEETPTGWQGDTPGSVMSTSTATTNRTHKQKPDIDTNMSLTAFQERYTSEDNESFYKLLDKQNSKKGEKYSWMWAGNKIPAARQIAYRNREQDLADKQDVETAENGGKELMLAEPKDSRKAMPDTWKSNPDNSLMFLPQSIEDTLQTVAQRNQETSTAPLRAVSYDNTRISSTYNPTSSEAKVPESPSLSAVRDAIAGEPRHSEASYNGASTSRVNGYAFVDDEEPKSPPPRSINDAHDNPLHLLNNDKAPNPFNLPDSSRREKLHHRMVEKVARGNRLTSGKTNNGLASQNQTPRFMSSPVIGRAGKAGLTPAGESLAERIGGSTPRRDGSASTPTGLWERKGRTPHLKGGSVSRLRDEWTPKVKKTAA